VILDPRDQIEQGIPILGEQVAGGRWLKIWALVSKSEPKLMPLAVMKPYELLPDRPLDILHMGL
jgi:hypothetical protein